MKSGLKEEKEQTWSFYYAFSLRPRGGEWDDECGGDNLEFWERGHRKVENNNVEERRE